MKIERSLTVHHVSPLFTSVVKKRTPKPETRLTISLPSELYDEITRIAKRDSRSRGWVIRKAVDQLIREEQPLLHPSRT
jgi:hypothetical protein